PSRAFQGRGGERDRVGLAPATRPAAAGARRSPGRSAAQGGARHAADMGSVQADAAPARGAYSPTLTGDTIRNPVPTLIGMGNCVWCPVSRSRFREGVHT